MSTVALVVGDALRRHGILAVLTGGACANLYSGGAYRSADVDLIVSGHPTQQALDEAMESIGFKRQGDRYVHPKVHYFVEFPRGPLAIGNDFRIKPVRRKMAGAQALALSATDSCRDRLAAFYHWNDLQSLRAAVLIAVRNRVSLERIRRWSLEEDSLDRFEMFLRELKASRHRTRRLQ